MSQPGRGTACETMDGFNHKVSSPLPSRCMGGDFLSRGQFGEQSRGQNLRPRPRPQRSPPNPQPSTLPPFRLRADVGRLRPRRLAEGATRPCAARPRAEGSAQKTGKERGRGVPVPVGLSAAAGDAGLSPVRAGAAFVAAARGAPARHPGLHPSHRPQPPRRLLRGVVHRTGLCRYHSLLTNTSPNTPPCAL